MNGWVPLSQYQHAYPEMHYGGPPSAVNGYGWHGNGYGWQVDPSSWKCGGSEVVEEVIPAQKVDNVEASLGERGSGLRSRGPVQDFYQIRDYHLETGTLFEDPEFAADDSSLYFSKRPDRRYEWKRPHELVDNPQLFVEGFSRFDVQQGELGDCWLLAAVANLTLYHHLFFQIVPDDQSFDDKYSGVFHFRFWQYGRWIDVVIDDRLPTYRGQLIFLHSTEENEFWSALLEKAYAKLHGSYEALKGGSTCEAMEDFTGGVTEMYELNASPPNFFKLLLKAYERGSLMGCSIEPDPNVLEAETPQGLIRGHAYSITQVKYVDIETPNTRGKIPLLRLRNPWGNENEWNGPWSDKSPEWRFISDSQKEELGLNFDHDGEFWMSFKDFQTHYDRIEICNLSPDSLTDEELAEHCKRKWEMSVFEGEWVRGVTAGGCRNFLDTFHNNPQYRITLTDVDEDDDDDKCTVIIALMQKNRRQQRNIGNDCLTIGFAVYYLPNPDSVSKPLNMNFFKYNASVARSPTFINLREVSCRFKLPPGTYCIVPSTFEPNEEAEFLLRVFSEHCNNMCENDNPIGYGEVDTRQPEQPSNPNYTPGDQPGYNPSGYNYPGYPQHPSYPQPSYPPPDPGYSPNYPAAPGYPPQYPQYPAPGYPPQYPQHPGYGGYPDAPPNYPPPPPPRRNPDRSPIKEYAPTPQETQEIDQAQEMFMKLAGEDMEIDWMELKQVLDHTMKEEIPNRAGENSPGGGGDSSIVTTLLSLICGTACKDTPLAELVNMNQSEITSKGFSKDICRSMVAMLDADKSGKLGYEEFKTLWADISNWKHVFKLYDKDASGALSGFEIREALTSAGYAVNTRVLNMVAHRYGTKTGDIQFDDFIMCAIKLKTMIELFKLHDPNNTNSASFSMDEWVETTIYS